MTVRELLSTFHTNLHLSYEIDGIMTNEIPEDKIDRQVRGTATERDHKDGLIINIKTV